jgi:hypothetical protein
VSERGWWTGLDCALCGERVKVTAGDARFSQPVLPGGKLGRPVAEHFECRTFHDTVAERLAQVREDE